MDTLPAEILARIFEFLPLPEQQVLANVCTAWASVVQMQFENGHVACTGPSLSDDFVEFVGKLPLSSFELNGAHNISYHALDRLCQRNPDLGKLVIRQRMWTLGLTHALQRLRSLRSLEFDGGIGAFPSAAQVQRWPFFAQLERLSVGHARLPDGWPTENLAHLTCSTPINLTKDGFQALRSLSLMGATLQVVNLGQGWAQLRTLELRSVNLYEAISTTNRRPNALRDLLSATPLLTKLVMARVEPRQQLDEALAVCHHLEWFEYHAYPMDASALRALANSSGSTLQHFSTFGGRFGDDDIAAFVDKCPRLTTLCIPHTRALTDAGLAAIGRLRSLTHLDISGCPSILPAGLDALRSCPLQTLSMYGLALAACQDPAALPALVDDGCEFRFFPPDRVLPTSAWASDAFLRVLAAVPVVKYEPPVALQRYPVGEEPQGTVYMSDYAVDQRWQAACAPDEGCECDLVVCECEATMTRCRFRGHASFCHAIEAPCLYRPSGCAVRVPRGGLSEHMASCGALTVICAHCRVSVRRNDLAAHLQDHLRYGRVTKSAYSGESVFRCPLRSEGCQDGHGEIADCPHYEIVCLGCRETLKRREYGAHTALCKARLRLPGLLPTSA